MIVRAAGIARRPALFPRLQRATIMRLRRVLAAVALIVAVAAGCQSRLKDERTPALESGTDKTITLDTPRYDQTITVTVSADVPTDVYLYLEKDQGEAERAIALGAKSDKLLASQGQTQSATLEAKVPAKEKSVLMVRSKKPGTATVKIVGK